MLPQPVYAYLSAAPNKESILGATVFDYQTQAEQISFHGPGDNSKSTRAFILTVIPKFGSNTIPQAALQKGLERNEECSLEY
jgi:hypothetical protein